MDFLLWQFSNSNRNALPPPSPPPPTRAPAPVTSLNGARGRRGIVVVVVVVFVSPVTVHHTHCAPAGAARLPCLLFPRVLVCISRMPFVFIYFYFNPPLTTPFPHYSILPQRSATIYIYQRRHRLRLRRRLCRRMPHFVKRRGTD